MFGATPSGLITFNLMEPTRRRYWLRGHDLDDGMGWVFHDGAELHSVSVPGFQSHSLSVSEARIERVAADLEIDLPPPSKRPEVFPIPAEILPMVRRHLCELRDGGETFLLDPVRDVLRLLIPCWLRQNARGSGKRVSLRVRDIAARRCLELIENQALRQLPNDVLLDACKVSERTLQYAIRDRFGMTPHEFIKARRLAKTRLALRRADHGNDTVGDIAAQFGFWHLGRFAAEYRKAFGELPSETLQTQDYPASQQM
jgi:AraC family ethanolamine operon transcriptional activator